jgi:hypothetical protein
MASGIVSAVIALNDHNWMFPIAYGFIESENGDNWACFINQVNKAIGDACKGLENVV